jgi:hypothetical protein
MRTLLLVGVRVVSCQRHKTPYLWLQCYHPASPTLMHYSFIEVLRAIATATFTDAAAFAALRIGTLRGL